MIDEEDRLEAEAKAASKRKLEAARVKMLRQQEATRLAAENRRLDEIARAEAEQAEAKRLEALKPESDKAETLQMMMLIGASKLLADLGNPWWSARAFREINAACNQIKMIVSNGE